MCNIANVSIHAAKNCAMVNVKFAPCGNTVSRATMNVKIVKRVLMGPSCALRRTPRHWIANATAPRTTAMVINTG